VRPLVLAVAIAVAQGCAGAAPAATLAPGTHDAVPATNAPATFVPTAAARATDGGCGTTTMELAYR
jgi:hypothetical protein